MMPNGENSEMAIQEDLIYFLKNGRFENINFGIIRSQLFEILGEPESIQSNRTKWNAELYLYDRNFEFYFEHKSKDARLTFIQLNYLDKYDKCLINFNEYGWTDELTFDKAIKFLNRHEIKFIEKDYPLDEEVKILSTNKNVKILFVSWQEDNVFRLLKFGRSIELTSPVKPPTKHISFEVEKSFYEQLRLKAEKTKTSIGNQCREIIENHLKDKNSE